MVRFIPFRRIPLLMLLMASLGSLLQKESFWDVNWIEIFTFSAFVVSFLVWLYKKYNSRFGLTTSYDATYERQDDGEFTYFTEIKGHEGLFLGGERSGRLTLRIEAQEQKRLEIIDVRFVNCDWERTFGFKEIRKYRFIKYKNAPREIVRITSLKDNEKPKIESTDDNRGGRELTYDPPKSLSARTFLWLTVEIEIGVEIGSTWEGYISFEHVQGGDKRRWARAPVKISNKSSKQEEEDNRKEEQKKLRGARG